MTIHCGLGRYLVMQVSTIYVHGAWNVPRMWSPSCSSNATSPCDISWLRAQWAKQPQLPPTRLHQDGQKTAASKSKSWSTRDWQAAKNYAAHASGVKPRPLAKFPQGNSARHIARSLREERSRNWYDSVDRNPKARLNSDSTYETNPVVLFPLAYYASCSARENGRASDEKR